MTIQLGVNIESRARGTLTERKDTFQYVPLLQGLRALLKNEEILDEVHV